MACIAHRSLLYGYGCCTDLTEVPGAGNTRVNTRPRGTSSIGSGGFHPTFAWHVLTGSTCQGQYAAVWAISTITTEAINREPQRVTTGATAVLTATDHRTAYPGGGASNKIMAVASPILTPARSPNATTSKRSDRKHKE